MRGLHSNGKQQENEHYRDQAQEARDHEDDILRARRIVAGDAQAFDDFYEEYFPKVYAFVSQRTEARQARALTAAALVRTIVSLPERLEGPSLARRTLAITKRTLALAGVDARSTLGGDGLG